VRPPFGFIGVGIMPAWRLACPWSWLSTSPRPLRPASLARGVAKLDWIEADEPGAAADVVRADVSSTHHARFAGVAERFQCSEQPVSAASSQVSAVLKSEPARPAISNQTDGFAVEARPRAVDPFAPGVGAADVLAWRAARDEVGQEAEVGNKSPCREGPDVIVEADMGIVLRVEHAPPWNDLAGGDGDEARPVQAQRPAASRTREQVQHAEGGAG